MTKEVLSTMKLALQSMQFIAANCCETHVRACRVLKIFPGVIPPELRSKGRGGREGGEGKEKDRWYKGGEGEREGRERGMSIDGRGGKEKGRRGRMGGDG
jgi:hypothetical protein